MKKRLILSGIFSTILLSSSIYADSIKKEILAQSEYSWNGTKYTGYPKGTPELTVEKYTIQPNSVLSWHTHVAPNAGYILEGNITVEDSNGHKHTYHQGDGVIESVNNVHRGIAGAEGAVLVVVYAGVKELPLAIPTNKK